jgi:hypothetical protein
MKRPKLEIHAMHTMCGISLLAEALTATYLDDQCQRAGGADSASSLVTVALIDSLVDRRKSN